MVYDNVLNNPDDFNFQVQQLGQGRYNNPIKDDIFVDDDERIAFASQIKNLSRQFQANGPIPSFEKAGARRKIFHDPSTTRVFGHNPCIEFESDADPRLQDSTFGIEGKRLSGSLRA